MPTCEFHYKHPEKRGKDVVICPKGIEYCKECGKVKIDVTRLFGEKTET